MLSGGLGRKRNKLSAVEIMESPGDSKPLPVAGGDLVLKKSCWTFVSTKINDFFELNDFGLKVLDLSTKIITPRLATCQDGVPCGLPVGLD